MFSGNNIKLVVLQSMSIYIIKIKVSVLLGNMDKSINENCLEIWITV